MKKIKFFFFMVVMVFAGGVALGQVPNIITRIPANGSSNVQLTSNIEITYDIDIERGTVPPPKSFRLRRTSDLNITSITVQSVDISFSPDNRTMIIPLSAFANLLPNTTYDVNIDAGFVRYGNVQSAVVPYGTWTFTTSAPQPPQLELNNSIPKPGDDNVLLSSDMEISFNQPVSKASTSYYLSLWSLPNWDSEHIVDVLSNNVSLSSDNKRVIIPFSAFNPPIEAKTEYVVYIEPNFVNSNGANFEGLEDYFSWSFETGAAPPPFGVDWLYTYPAQNEQNVPLNPSVTITFNENFKPGNSGSISVYSLADFMPDCTIPINSGYIGTLTGCNITSITSNSITFTITAPMYSNRTYTVDISAGALVSQATQSPISRTFWDFYPAPPLEIEWSKTTPAKGASNVLFNDSIIITFKKPTINIALFNPSSPKNIQLVNTSPPYNILSTNVLSAILQNDSAVAIPLQNFSPPIAAGTTYQVWMDDGFVTSFGGLTSSDNWTFTIESGPKIEWAYPSHTTNESGVLIKDTITIVFDQDVILGDIPTIGIHLFNFATGAELFLPITSPYIIFEEYNRTVKIPLTRFSSPLLYSTMYMIQIDAGFVQSVNGVDYIGWKTSSWRFTTEEAPPSPKVIDKIPENGDRDVLICTNIEITFDMDIVKGALPTFPPSDMKNIYLAEYQNNLIYSIVSVASELVTIVNNRTIIIPLSAFAPQLSSNTIYTVYIEPGFVKSLDGVDFESLTEEWVFEIGDVVIEWDGKNGNSDWHTYDNWKGNVAPGNNHNVLIPADCKSYPEIKSGSIYVNHLTIAAGGNLTLNGGSLSIAKTLVLKSSPNVNASFINKSGSLFINDKNVTIEQVMTKSDTESYYISSPVAGATRESLGGLGMQYWNNSTGAWVNVLNDDYQLEVGRGYTCRFISSLPKTINFSGKMNSGTIPVNVARTAAGLGWNLIGNPYQTAVDWNELRNIANNKTITDNQFWMYLHDQGGIFGTYDGGSKIGTNLSDSRIPSNHAFYVRVPVELGLTSGAFTFSPAAMVANQETYLRSQSRAKIPYIKLAGVRNDLKVETAIAFIDDTFDGNYGVEKRFLLNNTATAAIELFTLSNNLRSVISGLEYEDGIEIPLGFAVKFSGDYSIELIENLTQDVTVTLIDHALEDMEINLSETGTHSFSVTTSANPTALTYNTTRFTLKFTGELGNIFNAPEIDWSKTTPVNGTTAQLNTNIEITFDRNIYIGDDETYLQLVDLENETELTVNANSSSISVVENRTVIIPLSAITGIQPTTQYGVRLSSGFVNSSYGIPFEGFSDETEWMFTTDIPLPPYIDWNFTTPENGTTNVELNPTITVTFNEDITFGNNGSIRVYSTSPSTAEYVCFLSSSLIGYQTGGSISLSGNSITITPTALSNQGTLYTVSIDPNVIISTNTGLPFEGTTWNFTTLTTTPPELPLPVYFEPIQEATNVPLNQTIKLQFDKNIEFGNGYITVSSVKTGSNILLVNVSSSNPDIQIINGNILEIIPGALLPDDEYQITIQTGAIITTEGAEFQGIAAGEWKFSTLLRLAWSNEDDWLYIATYISNDELKVTVKFDIEDDTLYDYYYAITEAGITSLTNEQITEGDVTILSNGYQSLTGNNVITVTIDINNVSLNNSAWYNIHSIAKSANTYYSECKYTRFRTFMTHQFTPVDNAMEISIDVNPKIAFSEEVRNQADEIITNNNITSSNVSFVKKGDSNQISKSVNIETVGGERIFTIIPDIALDEETEYILSFNVYDAALRLNTGSTTFMTEDRTAPFIVNVNPVNGSGFISTTPTITVTYNENIIYLNEMPVTNNPKGLISSFAHNNIEVSQDDYEVFYNPSNFVLTINVTEPLNENTDYVILLNNKAIKDISGNIPANDYILNYKTTYVMVWKEDASNTSWYNPDNWVGGNVPDDNNSVTISSSNKYPVIVYPVNVANLTLEAGAELYLDAGGDLNISGVFKMKSSPVINSSFLHQGGIINVGPENIMIEQVMTNSETQTYILSSPVEGITPYKLGGLTMYWYDNATGENVLLPDNSPMETGLGYFTRFVDAPLLSPIIFSGSINKGNVSVPVYRGAKGGWNLIGNPYPTAVNWDELILENVQDSYWMWQNYYTDGGIVATYSGLSGISLNGITPAELPSNHGFIIKVITGVTEGSVLFTPHSMIPNSTSYLRDGYKAKVPYIKLAGIKNNITDETAIAFIDESFAGISFDVDKYFSNNTGMIELYSYSNNLKTAIKGLIYENNIEIPLCFSVKEAGNCKIELVENSAENVIENLTVILIDKLENKEINLSESGLYAFEVTDTEVNETRFTIKFSGDQVNIDYKNPDKHLLKIFTENKKVYIYVPQLLDKKSVEYQLFDMNGRVVNTGDLTTGVTNVINIQSSGVYLLNVKNSEIEGNYKVVVK